MKRAILSSLGILLIVAAISGMAISIFGVIGLWRVETDIKTRIDETLALLDTTLQTTSDGLSVASRSLEQADSALASLHSALQAAKDSVEGTLPLLDTLSDVTTQELPQTISKSQQAIQSAQNSAKIIDSTLSALASIPLIGLRGYDSTRPLSGSLAELSRSLDPIANSLASIEEPLTTSKDSLAAIGKSTSEMAQDLADIRASLGQARQATAQYKSVVATLQQKVVTARNNAPLTLDRAAWFITIVFLWLGLTQIGLLLQGLEMLGFEFKHLKRGSPELAEG
mgnify:CR=1 FL=1